MAGAKMAYEVTSRIFGGKGLEVGAVIELTEQQFNSSLYRTRVRKVAGSARPSLEVATPGDDDEKERLIHQLKSLGVSADKRSSVEKLKEKLEEAQQ